MRFEPATLARLLQGAGVSPDTQPYRAFLARYTEAREPFEIAADLFITEPTVRDYLRDVWHALFPDVQTRKGAAQAAERVTELLDAAEWSVDCDCEVLQPDEPLTRNGWALWLLQECGALRFLSVEDVHGLFRSSWLAPAGEGKPGGRVGAYRGEC